MRTHRRTVAALAARGVGAARELYTSVPSDTIRVAALVEISAAAASLARTVVKLRHLDPDLIAPHVTDRADLRAVLGRGRWLPTMVRHVPAPSTEPVELAVLMPAVVVPRRRVSRRRTQSGQLDLLSEAGGR
jgi:hypothetical protein